MMLSRRSIKKIIYLILVIIVMKFIIISLLDANNNESVRRQGSLAEAHRLTLFDTHWLKNESIRSFKNDRHNNKGSRNIIQSQIMLPDKENKVYYENYRRIHLSPVSDIPLSSQRPEISFWLRISDNLYTYSGYWDTRPDLEDGPVARVLGILRYNESIIVKKFNFLWSGNVKDDELPYLCYLWYKDQGYVKGSLKAFIYEEARNGFVGTFFLCYPDNSSNINRNTEEHLNQDIHTTSNTEIIAPYAVSFIPKEISDFPHKLIYLNQAKLSIGSNSSRPAVCTRALFGPYDDNRGILQFVAYYNLVLNIKHFYIYDLAITPHIKDMFNEMSKFDIRIEILPWNLPTGRPEELWDLGSLTATNDCVYRCMGRHDHVAIVDVDEFIVPMVPVTGLKDLYVKILQRTRGQQGDAALVANSFFCQEFSQNMISNNLSLSIFEHLYREERLWPPKSRSKMILTPGSIVSVGHHMAHNFVQPRLPNSDPSKGKLTNQISPKMTSILHHYRKCKGLRHGIKNDGEFVIKQNTVKDATMLKYKHTIMKSNLVSHFINS